MIAGSASWPSSSAAAADGGRPPRPRRRRRARRSGTGRARTTTCRCPRRARPRVVTPPAPVAAVTVMTSHPARAARSTARNGLPSTAAATSRRRSSPSSADSRCSSRSRAPAGKEARSASALGPRPAAGAICTMRKGLPAVRATDLGRPGRRRAPAPSGASSNGRRRARSRPRQGHPLGAATEPGERRAGRDVGVAVGADDEHGPRRHVGGDHVEQLQGPLVGPVEVVEHERAPGVRWWPVRGRSSTVAYAEARAAAAAAAPASGSGSRPERAASRPSGPRPLSRVTHGEWATVAPPASTPPTASVTPSAARHRDGLAGHRRLADPGVADEQQHPARPTGRLGERSRERVARARSRLDGGSSSTTAR